MAKKRSSPKKLNLTTVRKRAKAIGKAYKALNKTLYSKKSSCCKRRRRRCKCKRKSKK